MLLQPDPKAKHSEVSITLGDGVPHQVHYFCVLLLLLFSSCQNLRPVITALKSVVARVEHSIFFFQFTKFFVYTSIVVQFLR